MSHQLDVFYPWDVANTFSYISQKYQHFPTEKTKLWLFFFKQKVQEPTKTKPRQGFTNSLAKKSSPRLKAWYSNEISLHFSLDHRIHVMYGRFIYQHLP